MVKINTFGLFTQLFVSDNDNCILAVVNNTTQSAYSHICAVEKGFTETNDIPNAISISETLGLLSELEAFLLENYKYVNTIGAILEPELTASQKKLIKRYGYRLHRKVYKAVNKDENCRIIEKQIK